MKEWVCIPAPDEASCLAYVLEARTFVSALARSRKSQLLLFTTPR
jgi:hypothetical protein